MSVKPGPGWNPFGVSCLMCHRCPLKVGSPSGDPGSSPRCPLSIPDRGDAGGSQDGGGRGLPREGMDRVPRSVASP